MSHHKTAWVGRNHTSTLTSDRIKPSPPPSRPSSTAPKNKGKGKEPQVPKSAEVQALDSLILGLRKGNRTEKDPLGGCFCQARSHTLSLYTPICFYCGLILCKQNLPYHACPHCSTVLLSEAKSSALIDQLERNVTETLANEAAERDRVAEEARRAAGAFPTLGTSGGTQAPQAHRQQTSHRETASSYKVLSLGKSNNKVTVASYRSTPTHTPPPSRPESRTGKRAEKDVAVEAERVPPPPPDIDYVRDAKVDPKNPWIDLKGGRLTYVPLPRIDQDESGKGGRKKKKGTTKEKETREGTPGPS